MQYGWNYDYARQQFMSAQAFKINFMIQGGLAPSNNAAAEKLTLDFNKEDEAFIIIERLSTMRPLPKMNPQLYYKIYKDLQCKQEITYTNLMTKLKELGIQSNSTLFVMKDSKDPFA